MAKQVSSTNEIAEALIRLGVVGREQFEAELERGRLKGEEFAKTTGTKVVASQDAAAKAADRMGIAESRLGTAMLGVKRTAGEQIEVVTSLIGKITAIVGVTTLFYNIGERVSDVLFKNTKRAEDFEKAMDGATKSINNIRGFQGRRFSPEVEASAGVSPGATGKLAERLAEAEDKYDKAASEFAELQRAGGGPFTRLKYGAAEERVTTAKTEVEMLRRQLSGILQREQYAEQNGQVMALLKEIADNTKQRSN